MKKLPLIVLLFAAILLAACGPAATPTPAPTAVPPTETPAAADRYPGTADRYARAAHADRLCGRFPDGFI